MTQSEDEIKESCVLFGIDWSKRMDDWWKEYFERLDSDGEVFLDSQINFINIEDVINPPVFNPEMYEDDEAVQYQGTTCG